jgi:hypothetical protein
MSEKEGSLEQTCDSPKEESFATKRLDGADENGVHH